MAHCADWMTWSNRRRATIAPSPCFTYSASMRRLPFSWMSGKNTQKIFSH